MGKVRETVRNNLRTLVNYEQSPKAFAEKIGATKQAVNNWVNGSNAPDIELIAKIANIYGIPLSAILEGDLSKGNFKPPVRSSEWVEVPLFGSIAAGEPIEMESVDNTFVIPSAIRKKYPKAFLLKVEGESMNKKLPNGSYALINPTDDIIDGNAYAVCVNGYDATIKRINKLENGFELMPDSTDPTFKSKIYDYGVEGTETITVIGEVVWCVYPFDYSF